MPKVIIWRDGAIETEFDPGHRDWRMGRSETNDITLLDPRKSVSRFHAELREENGRWVFIDLNSQNGSWKDGLRVNRLVLEHGHEVLFGDYRLAFEDVKVAPPPPVPPTVDITFDASRPTMDEPLAPDQTLLMPGRSVTPPPTPPVPAPAPVLASPPVPASPPVSPPPPMSHPAVSPPAPVSAPPPVAARPPVPAPPPAARVQAPRKGINPLVLVLVLVAILGAMAAAAVVAWKVWSGRTVEPRVVQNTAPSPPEPAPAPAPDPTPEATAMPAATEPPAGSPPEGSLGERSEATPPPVATTSTPVPVAPVAPPTAPAPPASKATSASKATTPSPKSAARPKRAAPAASQENPATVARYEAGRRALTAGRFAEAERAFQAVLAQQPGFRDATARLAEARQGLAAARTTALADAAALEASGDWARAVAAYERAGASDEAAAARAKMTAAGDDAYRKARQFDARNRPTEATAWYQRAVEWLPDSDARKATAQERLAALKGGGA